MTIKLTATLHPDQGPPVKCIVTIPTTLLPVWAKDSKIDTLDSLIDALRVKLGSDIVGITYKYASNWEGRASLFYKVVLTDGASETKRLREVAPRVTAAIREMSQEFEPDLFPYVSFRSESEDRLVGGGK